MADAGELKVGIVPLSMIRFHPANVGRDLGDVRELVESIKQHGVLVPVILEAYEGGWRLRDGHRRVAAARMAGVSKVLAIRYLEPLDEADWLIQSVEFNEKRRGLDPADRQRIARRLVELRVSRARIAATFGISRAAVDKLLDPDRPAAPAPARPKPRTSVPVKSLRELLEECNRRGVRLDPDAHQMLLALIEGRPWETAA